MYGVPAGGGRPGPGMFPPRRDPGPGAPPRKEAGGGGRLGGVSPWPAPLHCGGAVPRFPAPLLLAAAANPGVLCGGRATAFSPARARARAGAAGGGMAAALALLGRAAALLSGAQRFLR